MHPQDGSSAKLDSWPDPMRSRTLDAVLTHFAMHLEAVSIAVQPVLELEAVYDDSIVVGADCNVESDDACPLDLDTPIENGVEFDGSWLSGLWLSDTQDMRDAGLLLLCLECQSLNGSNEMMKHWLEIQMVCQQLARYRLAIGRRCQISALDSIYPERATARRLGWSPTRSTIETLSVS